MLEDSKDFNSVSSVRFTCRVADFLVICLILSIIYLAVTKTGEFGTMSLLFTAASGLWSITNYSKIKQKQEEAKMYPPETVMPEVKQ
jgi:hypothetical protein